ncbi:MAG: type II toxin-antitoxin system prevent-host-death family antitoxin [Bacillota bacterium]|nr:type II toxin-antitoxin system prevent-host-death family antitoxin [Bacillota bacterium]
MLVNATDLKNNLGKYLREAMREEIIVVSSGRKVARLTAYEESKRQPDVSLKLGEPAEIYEAYPRKATYEEFLELTQSSDDRFEYIDGVIYAMASPKTVHQKALGEMYYVFASWFRGKRCRPMLAPYDITLRRFAEDINVVQPDLMVICDLEEKVNQQGYYMGVPDLMVEILSDSTRGKDCVKKMDLYLSTGIREYWIVNPFSREITVYLFDDKELVDNRSFQSGQNAASFVFDGLEIPVQSLFD